MTFRHLDYADDTPVEALGPAAIDDLLDRSDLAAWRPLLRAIARDPFGPVAETVLRVVEGNPRQGLTPLWRSWIARRRLRASGPTSAVTSLRGLREARGASQAAVAAAAGTLQSDLSKLERRADAKVSTLSAVLDALGHDLEVVAIDRETGRRVRVVLGDGSSAT